MSEELDKILQAIKEDNEYLKEKIRLANENKQLKDRIDKAIEYITSEEYFELNNKLTGSFSADQKNYFKAHDKLLKILEGDNDARIIF